MNRSRRLTQAFFLALTTAGVVMVGARCELWCPMGGVEALKAYWTEGAMVCSLGVSNFFVLGGVLAMTLLARRAFCGYVCPIGGLSELARWIGGRLGLKRREVSPRLDAVLALFKYAVLAAVLIFTWKLGELVFRGFCPAYALTSRHGTDITVWAYVVLGCLLAVSLVVSMPFCRWFCPLAAVFNPFARFGLLRIRRQNEACSDCGRCRQVCPTAIPVDRMDQVTASRCLLCLECVRICSRREPAALRLGLPGRAGKWGPLGRRAVLGVVFVCLLVAVLGAYQFPIPSFIKSRGTVPAEPAVIDLRVEGLTCRGRANQLWFFLIRNDLYELPGYLKLETWPGEQMSRVRIHYDPAQVDPEMIPQAIVEPYYNLFGDAMESRLMTPPFRVEGYDPLRR